MKNIKINIINAMVLDKNKKYLFIFDKEKNNITAADAEEFLKELNSKGFYSFGILIKDSNQMQIIEAENLLSDNKNQLKMNMSDNIQSKAKKNNK